MNEKEVMMIPYVVHENSEARHERKEKRLLALVLALIIALAASNMLWLYEWTQYDYVTTSEVVTLDSADGGNANYQTGGGTINNGQSEG